MTTISLQNAQNEIDRARASEAAAIKAESNTAALKYDLESQLKKAKITIRDMEASLAEATGNRAEPKPVPVPEDAWDSVAPDDPPNKAIFFHYYLGNSSLFTMIG